MTDCSTVFALVRRGLEKDVLFRHSLTNLDKLANNSQGMKLYIPDSLVPFILEKEHVPPAGLHVPAQAMFEEIRNKYYQYDGNNKNLSFMNTGILY